MLTTIIETQPKESSAAATRSLLAAAIGLLMLTSNGMERHSSLLNGTTTFDTFQGSAGNTHHPAKHQESQNNWP